jgi:hypothetical protein
MKAELGTGARQQPELGITEHTATSRRFVVTPRLRSLPLRTRIIIRSTARRS